MGLSTELERLHMKKLDLIKELLSIYEKENALKEMVKILEERLESNPPSLPTNSLEWNSSPKKVYSLYMS